MKQVMISLRRLVQAMKSLNRQQLALTGEPVGQAQDQWYGGGYDSWYKIK